MDDPAPDVQYPGRRGDIIESLKVLMTITPATVQQWPGLTEAVHWLVDDTGWDLYPDRGEKYSPTAAIGYMLRDDSEVAAINTVLDPLLAVLDELGPVETDTTYLNHERWPEVSVAARAAHQLFTTKPPADG